MLNTKAQLTGGDAINEVEKLPLDERLASLKQQALALFPQHSVKFLDDGSVLVGGTLIGEKPFLSLTDLDGFRYVINFELQRGDRPLIQRSLPGQNLLVTLNEDSCCYEFDEWEGIHQMGSIRELEVVSAFEVAVDEVAGKLTLQDYSEEF